MGQLKSLCPSLYLTDDLSQQRHLSSTQTPLTNAVLCVAQELGSHSTETTQYCVSAAFKTERQNKVRKELRKSLEEQWRGSEIWPFCNQVSSFWFIWNHICLTCRVSTTHPSLDSHPELCWINCIHTILLVGDLSHLLLLRVLRNLLCNLETLEKHWNLFCFEGGKKSSDKLAVFVYLVPPPTCK